MKRLFDEHLLNELDELRAFLMNNKKIYIYGHGLIGKSLFDYLKQFTDRIEGFAVSKQENVDGENVFTVDRIERNSGIIMGCDDKYYSEIIPLLVRNGIGLEALFFISQSNKASIVRRMKRMNIDEFHYSVHLAEHCNLNCQMCNAFSPIAEHQSMPFELYKGDCKRLSELFEGNMKWINLTGGEAILNPEVIKFIELTRREFPQAQIKLASNGLLLRNASRDFWKSLRENNIELWITNYPISMNYEELEAYAEKQGVKFCWEPDFFNKDITEKTSCRWPMDPAGNQERMRGIMCNAYQNCITLYQGKLFSCASIYPSKHLNKKFGTNFEWDGEKDLIDIYKVSSWKEIADFVTTIPEFCKYCNLGERKDGYIWKQSEGDRSEWIM